MAATNSVDQLIAMFVSLLVVLAVAIALAWLWKRFMPTNLMGQTGLDVVATRHIGAKERLLLIKVGERYLLLGATAQAINTLAEFTAEQLPDALQQLQQTPSQTQKLSPTQLLFGKDWLSKKWRSK
ncbi:flagellar biosynthetic protein FliO [Neiella marina]|uniref:Flagellar protein n=1 Tax=Neiella holothuriorum TaxID=2870530 RepID=A0ABS7EEM9_9GAMM|nr:flagellar biosynthetic protein FliO [Neiella holothuriorum]MBW8190797.1 flagellar biosynthetic protein FliO [Neiella holothuriorum]